MKQALRGTRRIAREYTLGAIRNANNGPLSVVPSALRILRARTRYGVGPVHYSLYRFAHIPETQWSEYGTDDPVFKQYLLDMSSEEMRRLLRNKVLFHDHCLRHRVPTIPVVCVVGRSPDRLSADMQPVTSPERWLSVIASAPDELFVKPLDGTHGEGAFTVLRTGERFSWEGRMGTAIELFAHLEDRLRREKESAWLIQPRLRSHASLASITSPSALATVRVITHLKNGVPRLLIADLKIPGGNSTVDNFALGATGNLLAAIDLDSGRLGTAWGSTRRDWPVIDRFHVHPDTGEAIKGFVLPFWDELVALALRAQQSLPLIPTVGWDIAATDRGLIVVEANTSYDLSILQIAHERGLKREIVAALR
ncbi:MAG: sugar-transfer associated ATP-grasp domain-containing protein [Gammaproteobacteria bacterium]